jgi:hypothetical protein
VDVDNFREYKKTIVDKLFEGHHTHITVSADLEDAKAGKVQSYHVFVLLQ